MRGTPRNGPPTKKQEINSSQIGAHQWNDEQELENAPLMLGQPALHARHTTELTIDNNDKPTGSEF
jgi:hypothetical protein